MKKLLVINAGSSSMKFRIYNKETLEIIVDGLAERLFIDGVIKMDFNDKEIKKEVKLDSHLVTVNEVIKLFIENKIIDSLDDIVGIGHRVVQGGEIFKESALIGPKEIKQIEDLSPLAPLHNPGAVQVMKAFIELTPNAKNVAVFDTSFHQTIPQEVFMYGVPIEWYKEHGVRKYGMHGTSHKYITNKVEEILGKDKVNIISAHLGNGASLAAVKDSKCYNTSMGLTPLAGIIMGTRSGDLDPAIIEYMCKKLNKDVSEVTNILNKESGIKGLSQVSSDFRDIQKEMQKGNEKAIMTMNIYAKRVADVISQYQNDLENKVDAIVFTAGIGENASIVREYIMKKIHTLDLEFDYEKNSNFFKEDVVELTKSGSKTKVFMIRTNEELMIVNDLIEKASL